MQLEANVVTWLDENLPDGAVDPFDLEETYSGLDQDFVPTPTLIQQQLGRNWTPPFFKWRLTFAHADGREIVDPPLQRKVYGDLPLYGGGRGVVVENDAFHIQEPFQGKGFARAVCGSEEALFNRWGVREIHLTAIEAGRVVWLKKFGFVPVYTSLLAEEYEAWHADHPALGPEPPLTPAEYPVPFLYSLERIMLWKELP